MSCLAVFERRALQGSTQSMTVSQKYGLVEILVVLIGASVGLSEQFVAFFVFPKTKIL